MAQDRPPAPQFPRDEVDPKTTIGSAQNQQPFVEYFARAPPESGTKGTWPAPEAFEAAPKLSAGAVVAFWGDHGWHLGDNDQWAKMTNFEQATRIPLMIGCGGGGCTGRSSALVEAIDIMPTILEEAGLPVGRCPAGAGASRRTRLCTEGRSLSPLLRAPGAYETL